MIGKMEAFFGGIAERFDQSAATVEEAMSVLAYQRGRFEDPKVRYAFRVREEYGEDFVEKGLELARSYSER